MNKAEVTLVHAPCTSITIHREVSNYAKSGMVYFVPDGVELQNTVKAEKYNNLVNRINGNIVERIKLVLFGVGND